jgi:hypothetical protein
MYKRTIDHVQEDTRRGTRGHMVRRKKTQGQAQEDTREQAQEDTRHMKNRPVSKNNKRTRVHKTNGQAKLKNKCNMRRSEIYS